MDVINSGIIIIGNRYYRNNAIAETHIENEKENDYKLENFDEDICDYEEIDCKFDIKQAGQDYICNLNVAPMFYCFIIGKRGESKKKIEMDTKTNIILPKHEKSGQIIINGKNYRSVERAVNRIFEIVDYGRNSLPFTHFFSIHVNNESIINNFNLFKNEVLHNCIGDRGIEHKLFQNPLKLHLTLSILVIGDHYELNNVNNVFNQFKSINSDLFQSPIRVHIKGLEYMNDDPCEVRVLYGKVADELDKGKLQNLANKLVEFLANHRIISKKNSGTVTLHMTLLNASFLSEQDSSMDTANDVKHPKHFDCSNILKKFSDWDFGILEINNIDLSKRYGASSQSYYTSAASFKFGCEDK